MIPNPPTLLYKYRSLSGINRKHTEDMLRYGKIYFAQYIELNDPQEAFITWPEKEESCNFSDKELDLYPIIKIMLTSDLLLALYTKHEYWAYEHEWRFIYKAGCHRVPRRAIRQIIFGPNISDLDKMYVESLLSDLVDIDFFTVKLSDDNYGYQLIKVEKMITSETV